jgi:hypothetical protein
MSDSEPEEGQDLAAMSKKEFRLHMKRQRRQGAAAPLEEEEEEEGGGATHRAAPNHYGDHRKWKKVDVGDMVMGGSEGGTCVGAALARADAAVICPRRSHEAYLAHCAHAIRPCARRETQ